MPCLSTVLPTTILRTRLASGATPTTTVPNHVFGSLCRAPLTLALLAITAASCIRDDAITKPFSDEFSREEIGGDYHNTGAPYRIRAGSLNVSRAYNHPLWLSKRLPDNATIEFDVTSHSNAGDIKVEAWGDGRSHATTRGAYLATSYVFIFGGWGNSVSALCRMDEHAPDRKTRKDRRVERGRRYHFRIERSGGNIRWSIDGEPFLALDDPNPLKGDRHAYFGFNNWESEVSFDNLRIRPR